MKFSHLLSILLLTTIFWPLQLIATPRYYQARLISQGEEIGGYAEIDKSEDGHLLGRMCTYRHTSIVGSLEPLGTLSVEGRIEGQSMTLTLRPNEQAMRTRIKDMLLSNDPLKLTPTSVGAEDNIVGPLLSNGPGWQTDYAPSTPYLEIKEIDNNIRPVRRYTYARMSGPRPSEFDLSRFDAMTPEEAFNFVINNRWNETISPTIVRLVYRPQDREEITQFLKQYGSLVSLAGFDGPAVPDCGAPFVESEISVVPLLEYYFSRKLQKSGLVARAHPDELYLTPPFITMRLRSLAVIMRSGTLTIDQKLSGARAFFEARLMEYLSASRPRFAGSWEVKFKNSGGDHAYRWEVVGPAVSACVANKWEKFDVLIAFMMGESPEIALNVLEGYEAPGSFSQRPSDIRFKENPLGDDNLGKIQDKFYGFLVKHGIGVQDGDDKPSNESCPL